jgi:hypothetical protein
MCVSLSVIWCNNKHLHIQRVYKEIRIRKTESFIICKIDFIVSQFKPIYIIKIYFPKLVFNIILHFTIACKASYIGVGFLVRAVYTNHQHFLKLIILEILNEQYVLCIMQYHILRKNICYFIIFIIIIIIIIIIVL